MDYHNESCKFLQASRQCSVFRSLPPSLFCTCKSLIGPCGLCRFHLWGLCAVTQMNAGFIFMLPGFYTRNTRVPESSAPLARRFWFWLWLLQRASVQPTFQKRSGCCFFINCTGRPENTAEETYLTQLQFLLLSILSRTFLSLKKLFFLGKEDGFTHYMAVIPNRPLINRHSSNPNEQTTKSPPWITVIILMIGLKTTFLRVSLSDCVNEVQRQIIMDENPACFLVLCIEYCCIVNLTFHFMNYETLPLLKMNVILLFMEKQTSVWTVDIGLFFFL